MATKKAAEPAAEPKKKKEKISFNCSEELQRDLKDLAYLSRRDVSSLMVEVATELVKANRKKIDNSRRRKPYQVNLPTFNPPAEPAANTGTAEGGDDA